ncbi:3'(2'),5'-bisphosphate nucleotidase CysQ [Sphaerospermopsis aphanizomenoides BCCUSP55]|uniref:3'(2'),5'-bisphosphate nucleotidase CysQ family protein n=1 Tax=Sphaerospermopsis aphanizomenoides TaxID=459663 RepID=UPI000B2A7ED1|nr:3'(2'),5'-bisphosphate nucleotidase CysQ [Sphaerospermopsis aphanizomenoides]MBK1986137.1 3'(2'),5'-bisphosphate nucleotidase CysQ [Sphaerospermopsis aphanizomenoides BCCUSP55]
MTDLEEILKITREVGWGAAKLLRSYYQGTAPDPNLDVQYKQNEPVTVADVAVSKYILSNLQSAFGQEDFGYICEETYKTQQGKNPAELVWIIDPLDGTRDFIDKTGEYAIHIALVQDTRPVLAVVAIPEAEKIYYATKGGGTFVETVNGCHPLKVPADKPIEDLTLVVSRSHRNDKLEYLLKNLPCQKQKAIGSVGCKVTTIVEQQADVYISLSGKSAPKDWDMAAPELILTEAGGKFTHFDGKPLEYNTGDVNQWGGLLASSSQDHEILCQKAEQILYQFEALQN